MCNFNECIDDNKQSVQKERLFMDVRLFRLAVERWHLSRQECASLFRKYDIFGYIADAYEEFHEQGDEANMEDIEAYLAAKGAIINDSK